MSKGPWICDFVLPSGRVCNSFPSTNAADHKRHMLVHYPEMWPICQHCEMARRGWEASQPEGSYIANFRGTHLTGGKWSQLAPDKGPNIFATAQKNNLNDHIKRKQWKTRFIKPINATIKGPRSTAGTSKAIRATVKNSRNATSTNASQSAPRPSIQPPSSAAINGPRSTTGTSNASMTAMNNGRNTTTTNASQWALRTPIQPASPFLSPTDSQFPCSQHLDHVSSKNSSPHFFAQDLPPPLTPGLSNTLLNLRPFEFPFGNNTSLDNEPETGARKSWLCLKCFSRSSCMCSSPAVTGGEPIYDTFSNNQVLAQNDSHSLWSGRFLGDVPDMGYSSDPSPVHSEQLLTPLSIQGHDTWSSSTSSPLTMGAFDFNAFPYPYANQSYPTTPSYETSEFDQYVDMDIGQSDPTKNALGLLDAVTFDDLIGRPNRCYIGDAQDASINERDTFENEVFNFTLDSSHVTSTSSNPNYISGEDFLARRDILGYDQ